jgi:preprotein translocase subunit SecG
MSFITGILSVVLLANCAVLIFLVLIQLPKKDAGVGMAFGGGAADALFGAGSGNVLTKITKWAAGIFFGLALILGVIQAKMHASSSSADFQKQLEQKESQMPVGAPPTTPLPTTPVPSSAPSTPAAPAPAGTNAAAK